jgi:solute carrier family 25 protein 42
MAGSLAGMTATTLTYPLDMARARMAITKATFYKSLYQTFHSILFNEGPLKLYRGLVPTLLGVFPYAGSSFFTYETLKDFYRKRYKEQPTPLAKLVSGALAGLVGQSFSYPLDVVRRRMQTEGVLNSIDYRTVLTTIRYIYKTEGLRGVYKGVTMNWIKGPIAVTISFNVYEIVSHFLKRAEYHY